MLASVDFIYNDRNRPIPSDVARGAKTIHGHIEGNHQGQLGLAKPKHTFQDAQCRHNSSAGNPRGRNNGNAQHTNKAGELRQRDALPPHNHNG